MNDEELYKKKPAKVEYIESITHCYPNITSGKVYSAYFIEYWQGERRNLHLKNDKGVIDYWYDLKDFKIIEDVDYVLNFKEAKVRCIRESHSFSELALGNIELTNGKEYIAIGIGGGLMGGLCLILEVSYDHYFYPHAMFEIVSDPDNFLDSVDGIIVYEFVNTFDD